MGLIADARLRRPPRDPWEPSNVGATDGEFNATATLIVPSGDAWEYGGEIGIGVVPAAWYELPFGEDRLLYWSGMEVTLSGSSLPRSSGGSRKGKQEPYFVVAALEPAAWGWSACAPLRRVLKRSARERAARIEESLESGSGLRDLTWDPFLQDHGKYAARLNDPLRLHYENGRNLGNGFVVGTQPDRLRDAVWRFGLCPGACLEAFGWTTGASASPPPRSGIVRVPRSQAADAAQAAAWFALSGRAEGDSVTLAQVRADAENALVSLEG